MKKTATIFMFVVLNGTWAFMAYLIYRTGVPLRVIAIVVPIGVLLGNVAVYAGLRITAKLLRKSGT